MHFPKLKNNFLHDHSYQNEEIYVDVILAHIELHLYLALCHTNVLYYIFPSWIQDPMSDHSLLLVVMTFQPPLI